MPGCCVSGPVAVNAAWGASPKPDGDADARLGRPPTIAGVPASVSPGGAVGLPLRPRDGRAFGVVSFGGRAMAGTMAQGRGSLKSLMNVQATALLQ
jgi:hypothetical protein